MTGVDKIQGVSNNNIAIEKTEPLTEAEKTEFINDLTFATDLDGLDMVMISTTAETKEDITKEVEKKEEEKVAQQKKVEEAEYNKQLEIVEAEAENNNGAKANGKEEKTESQKQEEAEMKAYYEMKNHNALFGGLTYRSSIL